MSLGASRCFQHHGLLMYHWGMRTTINLPEDLHRIASAIARDRAETLSQTLAELVRRALSSERSAEISISQKTGLPVVSLGTPITGEDVRTLEDE